MSETSKTGNHDSTACMAAAWFGTQGCGEAIERVFGAKVKEPNMESKADTQVKVTAHLLVVVTDDHGGYRSVKCVICGSCGWEGQLKHEPDCVVGKALAQEVPC
jgi:hypothetical protein